MASEATKTTRATRTKKRVAMRVGKSFFSEWRWREGTHRAKKRQGVKMQPSLQGEGNHAILRTDPCDRDERGHRGCVCGRKKKRGALDGGKKRWNGGGHRARKSSRRRGHAKREQVRPNSIPTESRPVHVKAEHIARIRTSKARMGESKGSIQREICSCEGRAKPCFSWCDLVDKPHATVLGLRSATWRRVSREELSCFLRFTDEVGGSGLV